MLNAVLEFDFATAVLSEYDADGFLGIAVDHYGEDDAAGAPPAEAHHLLGFAARPVDPQKSGPRATVSSGATVLHFFEGQRAHAIALQDHRFKAPALAKGGSAHYCPAVPSARALFNELGAYDVTIPEGQTARIAVGSTTLVIEGGKVTATTKSGSKVEIGAGGITITGGNVTIGDAAVPVALAPAVLAKFRDFATFAATVQACLSTATLASGLQGGLAGVAASLVATQVAPDIQSKRTRSQ